ncbi:hypothetical protein JCM11641_004159 [Rhodosporidiobolus odoratus]
MKRSALPDQLDIPWELSTYSPDELNDDVSLIEPLSTHSLSALRRLARYKPPEDPYELPAGRSAVLVALFGSRSGQNLNMLLSTRSAHLRTYPGQVALPGGKMDAEDINLEATARREAFEEIGLPIDTTQQRYLTALPPFLARSTMLVTPIVCFVLDYSLKPELNQNEVADLFSFPLEGFLTSDARHPVLRSRFPAGFEGDTPYHSYEDYAWYDGLPHRFHSFRAGSQPVTGLTAEILIHVASIAYGQPADFALCAPNQRAQVELTPVEGMAKLGEVSDLDIPQHLSNAAEELTDKAGSTTLSSVDWTAIARAGKKLADGLRSEELRTSLGSVDLLTAVGGLLHAAVRAEEGTEELLNGQTELARVVGNMCFEHDANRQRCLDADIPLALAALLSRMLELAEEGEKVEQQRALRMEELKFVRATVGALLNMSLKFDPVRRELTKVEILTPLLAILDARTSAGKLTAPIYTCGCWASEPAGGVQEWEERLQISSTVISWTVNVLEDVLSESKASFPSSGILSLSSAVLAVYASPAAPAKNIHFTGEDASDFLDTDIELLSVSAALLEGVTIDLDSSKSILAFSTYNSTLSYPSSSLLEHLLTFIHSASPPSYWSTASDDPERTTKAFSTIKAAVVRAVVEAPNSDEVMERLWKETRTEEGEKSWLVQKMVLWLEEAQGAGREDMLICAAHLLAGLGRKDKHTESLVHDYGLAAPLARIVNERVQQQLSAPSERGRPGETTQILFGVVSLLRHLAIPVKNRQVVGETGVIASVALLLRKELDIVGPLQLTSIGLLKHLIANNIPNSLEVLGIPPPADEIESPASSLPLDHVLALISRTDDTRLRSEATRVVVNLVRSVYSSKPAIAHRFSGTSTPARQLDDEELLRAHGCEKLIRQDVADALSELVRLSEKYPMLSNEGIVALAMLAGSGETAAALVLSSLVASHTSPPPPSETPTDEQTISSGSAAKRATSLAVSPAGDPPTSVDMLATWLGLVASNSVLTSTSPPSNVRPVMIANATALVIAVLQRTPSHVEGEKKRQLDELRAKLLGPLQGAKEALGKQEGQQTGALKQLVDKAYELVTAA